VASDNGVLFEEMMGDQVRSPPEPLPLVRPELTEQVPPGLRAWWFGHATVLIELDGFRVLTDPMLSSHAFPVRFFAPERSTPPPLSVEELPRIDVVTISHDHFDHLDMETVQALAERGTHFFVGLGVGAHLEVWEVPADQIHELDWWESAELGGLTLHCTPARHYTGRRSMGSPTLWASWVIEGPEHRVFHSGDSGYGTHFTEIRDECGPIDMSFVKIGDYGADPGWEDVHMTPESSVQAHIDVGAKTMFPTHWGIFDLSYHAWDEPIERATKAARERGVDLVTPMLGQEVVFGSGFESSRWWERVGAEPQER
jgi:L-ascorbate metabolism protein UlaG (beta-lactamase superfamily)